AFQQASYTLPQSFVGTTARLIFEWYNDSSTGTQPAAFDNVSVSYSSCFAPTAVSVSDITATSANLNWTNSAATNYDYEVRTSGAAGSGATGLGQSGTVAGGPVALPLTPQTPHVVYLRSNCDPEFGAWIAAGSFTTPKQPINVYPWNEPFTANDG